MMYVHLFWMLGHPEVYILIMPPMSFLSRMVAEYTHKGVLHRQAQVLALQLIGIIGFYVYGQHMFTMGTGVDTRGLYQSMTLLVGIPTAQKILTWIGAFYGTCIGAYPVISWLE